MWEKIIGHSEQKEQLRHIIAGGNVHHAYVFSGIDGVGKKLTAKAVAKTLLCSNPTKEIEPCEECQNCKTSPSGNHPDLIEIKSDGEQITIESIREIKDQLRFAPYQSKRRAIIIDHAELMNTNAANAALKILEEPPAGNHFFLITSVPTKLLPTIISRCQAIPFSPLKEALIEKFLISQHGYTKDQARAAGSISEGSLERALGVTPALIDTVEEGLAQILGPTSGTTILEWALKFSTDKDNIGNILYIIHRYFHKALLDKKDLLDGEKKLISLITTKNNLAQLIEKSELLNRTHNLINTTFNKQLMFEQLLFSLAG